MRRSTNKQTTISSTMQNEIKRHRHRVQQQQNHRNGVFDYNNTTISSQQLIDILGTYQL